MTVYAGVYEIRNIINGHRYIGSSSNLQERLRQHRGMLRRKDHHSQYLQRAWNKYGKTNFEMRPLLYCDPELTLVYEQKCLDKFHPEYNIASCAEASARGAKRSKLTREKISKAQKGRTVSNETIRKRVISREGYEHSEETKTKISEAIYEWHNTDRGRSATKKATERRKRMIICLNTGVVYQSIKEAEIELGVDHSKISAVARGKRNHSKGYQFLYVEPDV